MPIYSFTKDKIDELDSQMNDKQGEYDRLDKKTEKDLWNDDLNAFLEKYQEFIDEYEGFLKQLRLISEKYFDLQFLLNLKF